jgi:hypothetical protein
MTHLCKLEMINKNEINFVSWTFLDSLHLYILHLGKGHHLPPYILFWISPRRLH